VIASSSLSKSKTFFYLEIAMHITIETPEDWFALTYEGLSSQPGESSGICPNCDGDITEGEWIRFGICIKCVQENNS
jgi:hypothetical protein